MKTCLEIAGLLQLLLAAAHFVFAQKLGWREELQRVSLLTRQIFWVHTGFLMLVLSGFGLVSLVCTDELLTASRLSRIVLGGLAVFWGVRLYCQFFVYRPELWRGDEFKTRAHVGFALLWFTLAGVYGAAFLRVIQQPGT